MLIVYHENSVRFPSLFAKQNGRPDIVPAKRGTVMIGFTNHYTTIFRGTGKQTAQSREIIFGTNIEIPWNSRIYHTFSLEIDIMKVALYLQAANNTIRRYHNETENLS